jgi:hypothetical protein
MGKKAAVLLGLLLTIATIYVLRYNNEVAAARSRELSYRAANEAWERQKFQRLKTEYTALRNESARLEALLESEAIRDPRSPDGQGPAYRAIAAVLKKQSGARYLTQRQIEEMEPLMARRLGGSRPDRFAKLRTALTKPIDAALDDPEKLIYPAIWGLICYFVMLAGILTGSLFEYLDQIDGKKRITLRMLFSYMRTARSWQGVLASPIVFILVAAVIPKFAPQLSIFILCYQNGFFWRTTLKKYEAYRERQNAPNPPPLVVPPVTTTG